MTFNINQFITETTKRLAGKTGKSDTVPDYNGSTTNVTQNTLNVTRVLERKNVVLENAIDCIGGTPMIRLDTFAKAHGLRCNLLAKVEFMSIGGSVKDRIGRRMIEEAESKGLLAKGDVVIEATSGNTGIGLALMCAAKGYRMVVVMPHKMSMEKENVLSALGAVVIRTRSSASYDDVDGHLSTAYTLRDVINEKTAETGVTAVCVDQYQNTGNINAHYYETAVEIVDQTQGKCDMFVATAGTGGTISGISERLKIEIPSIKIVGVDPEGSILSFPKNTVKPEVVGRPYEVEGIGYDFHPMVFHHESVDLWYKSTDKESFALARELMRSEGLLCGGSSGSALQGAIQAAKDLTEDQTVVVLLPDSIRNYLSKFVSDDWMLTHGIFDSAAEHKGYKLVDASVDSFKTIRTLKLSSSGTIEEGLKTLNLNKYDYAAVLDDDYRLMAIMSREELSLWNLEGKGDQKLIEVANPHSIYPFSNENLTPQDIGEARIALISHNGEGRTRCGVLTVIPKNFAPAMANAHTMLEKRNTLCAQNFSAIDINVITKTGYLKATKFGRSSS